MIDRFVVGIDPGLMTGIAMWERGVEKPRAWQLTLQEMYEWVREDLVNTFVQVEIACEAFIITPQTLKVTRQPWSLELIGLLRWAAWHRGHKFELQTPASAKSFAPNEKLKELGWHVPGKDHANDALRHVFLYCAKHRLITL